ncbi:hypothetical protein ACWGDT_40800 [Streptomyces avermitilis]
MTTRAGRSRTGRRALARRAAAVCALGLAGCSQGAQVQSADTRADTAGRPGPAVPHEPARSKDTVAPGYGYGYGNVGWDDWRAGSALT